MISEQIARSIAFSPGSPVDFETAKDRLRLRFRSHGYVAGEHFWGRQLAHGLVANLALDWPDRVENVSTPQIKQWGHSAEDLWQIALTNLAREALPQAKRIVIQGPVSTQLSYYLLEGDSMFVASHALRLPNVDTGVARFGWIFMVPNRHTLYFTGIMNLSECGAAAMMLMQCSSSILARPGLLSDQLYWTDGTRFEHLARTERMTGQQVVESIQEALPRFAGAGSGPLTRQ